MVSDNITRAQKIINACAGRAGNMSKRYADETDNEFAERLAILAMKDIKQDADVYVASGVTEGIAGFYVASGDMVSVDGFVRA